MWLNRLPSEYRRRYYTNVAVIAGFVVFFVIVGRLGKQQASLAILSFIGFLLLFMCVWPLVRLLQCNPRPKRSAFIFYATWIIAYAYVGIAFFVQGLPAVPIAAVLGLVLMWAFLIAHRRVIFPNAFDGGFRTRWQMIREAQRAERAEGDAMLTSIRNVDR
jgi:hypothetical protein